jgi:spore maturation protein CgeB
LLIERTRKEQPDLVFFVETDFLMSDTIHALRETGAIVMIFHPDNPLLSPSVLPPHSSGRPEHIPAARASDCYFIWSKNLVTELGDWGVSPVRYLPFAWDPEAFPYVSPVESPKYPVVFIGNWDKKRERRLTHVAKNFDLKIWGTEYWKTRTKAGSPLKECWQGEPLFGKEAADVIANSKVCLNILRDQNLPGGTNMRTFEVPGAGGFLLSTWSEGADAIFPEGEAGAYFRSVNEMLDQIKYYLDRGQERQEIAQRAHAVAKKNTYTERVEKIIENQVCIKFERDITV